MMHLIMLGLLLLALAAGIIGAIPATAPAVLLFTAAFRGMPSCAHFPMVILLGRLPAFSCKATDAACLCSSGALLKAIQHRVAAACSDPADILASHQWVTARCADDHFSAPALSASPLTGAHSDVTSPAAPSRLLLSRLHEGRHNRWILRLYLIVFLLTALWNSSSDQDEFLRLLLQKLQRFRDTMLLYRRRTRLWGDMARSSLHNAEQWVRGLWRNYLAAWTEYNNLRVRLASSSAWPPPLGSLFELEQLWLRVLRFYRVFAAAHREKEDERRRLIEMIARCRAEREQIQEAFGIIAEGVSAMNGEVWPRNPVLADQDDDQEIVVEREEDVAQGWEDDDDTIVGDGEDGIQERENEWEDLGEDDTWPEGTWEEEEYEWEDFAID
ncbi:hypothetical protein VTJ83DRAFT_118 [Remersonia thermophila]|uniref:CFEM domain-containing protein n=1 Tax=Remersonia thermophila TaxID=72144 RepID=A0ABR4DKD6_9PEZI